MSVEFEDDIARFLCEENLLIARWNDAPTMDQLGEMRRLNERLSARYGNATAFMNVICKGTPSFSPEVHRETSDQARRFGARGLGTAHLVLIDGLVGMTVRSFLSTITLVARTNATTQVFGGYDEAADWFLPRLKAGSVAWSPDRLRGAYATCLA